MISKEIAKRVWGREKKKIEMRSEREKWGQGGEGETARGRETPGAKEMNER